MDNLIFLTMGLIALLMLAVLVLAKVQSGMRGELSDSQARMERLMEELKALYAGAAGQGKHIARMEEQISSLFDRQEKLDAQDPTSQSYSEAVELIHAGASIEELIRRGLRREEAELLMRLHGEQSLD